MATVHNLGLFPRYACPQAKPENFDSGTYVNISTGYQIEHAVAHYWRVKKWRFTVSMVWSEDSPTVAQFEDSFSIFFPQRVGAYLYYESGDLIVDETDLSSVPLSERDLICTGRQTSVLVQRAAVIASSGTYAGGAGTGYSAQYRYFEYVPAYYTQFEILPSFEFEMETNSWAIRAVPFSGNSGVYGILAYKVPGSNFDIPLYAARTRAGSGNDLNVLATLEPAEYWPYDPEDGLGPIYDASSGEELRSPLVTLNEAT